MISPFLIVVESTSYLSAFPASPPKRGRAVSKPQSLPKSHPLDERESFVSVESLTNKWISSASTNSIQLDEKNHGALCNINKQMAKIRAKHPLTWEQQLCMLTQVNSSCQVCLLEICVNMLSAGGGGNAVHTFQKVHSSGSEAW